MVYFLLFFAVVKISEITDTFVVITWFTCDACTSTVVCSSVSQFAVFVAGNMQVFRVEMYKWQLDVHNLNQFIAELKRTAPAVAMTAVIKSAAELNNRWNQLTVDANEREVNHSLYMCKLWELYIRSDPFPGNMA